MTADCQHPARRVANGVCELCNSLVAARSSLRHWPASAFSVGLRPSGAEKAENRLFCPDWFIEAAPAYHTVISENFWHLTATQPQPEPYEL